MHSRIFVAVLLSTLMPVLWAHEPVHVQNYSVDWLGNSYSGGNHHVPQDIDAIWVTPDGTVYSNVFWEDEATDVPLEAISRIPGRMI